MPCFAAVCQLPGHREPRRPAMARVWRVLGLWLALTLGCVAPPPVLAQAVEVLGLMAAREGPAVNLDYQLRVTLPRTVEDAALRGLPLYFAAQATLWKPRWYWRDERVARERREWRLSFQPLTSTWRVSQGGLGQSFGSLAEALATMTRSSGWQVAEARELDGDVQHYVEFSWRLDTSQLPRPMQISLSGVGGATDWAIGAERTVRVADEPAK